ncbi:MULTISPECIES: 5'/3'-nucleotidase SurE [Cycloclasticus]|jgi:5'-nucleotidase|uniref:5'-nucleotidase SurE n=2 Tax=Cycloclasticus TaxID=34067 RepID=S5TGB3_9GAMM|nr:MULTISPECIES: 5'/3'-nucleotidase SurE [Cycloclasticus]AGS39887.1 5'-nucleotidase [Cycloclasticus zancles 78-ME]ATI03322.1 5'/3'-nucleotidase SurE [Cycloclasticus sp. PY97N]EPD12567.1 5'(3')-nucleotidase/polyphosphatase [Cycloclasticus pugetii]MDF1828888.1 5'/3'-nucleotidase SurE [Cycloclasticus pugetii]SHJ35546.1 5'-nucleotidase /3'-nucleotidase /exopolyphosphatase [Cycloclasticus pugetii]|tara:strand:- start:91 stop:843 length:753 start_codon:yes stop_codon:yes gene_type:complete
MHILVSNDDGYLAPGLSALANKLSEVARVTVVAPDRNRSAASNSLTLDMPLRVQQMDNGYFSVDGTPTDCVHLAITGLLKEDPSIVFSGINNGENMGDDVLYSGTVAAATEGRFLGLPSIAISITSSKPRYFETAANIAVLLLNQLIVKELPADTILNVNVPDLPLTEIKGLKATRLGQRHRSEPVIEGRDPRNKKIYWVGPPGAQQDAGEETDFYAVENGYVSITPLKIDLTNYQRLNTLNDWLEELVL